MTSKADERLALRRKVEFHHRKARWAMERGDMAAFHQHARQYHCAASEHDRRFGGSIRAKYAG